MKHNRPVRLTVDTFVTLHDDSGGRVTLIKREEGIEIAHFKDSSNDPPQRTQTQGRTMHELVQALVEKGWQR